MTTASSSTADLIARARAGDRDALGVLLEQHRAYLKLITQRTIGAQLGARLDDSDIVQQTCLSAFGNIHKLLSDHPDQFAAWLRKIHERNVQNAVRDHAATQKRAIDRQQSLDESGLRLEPPAQQTSPSQRLLEGERAVELAAALQTLPADQREAVRLRYLEGESVEEIARRMRRTRFSVAGLIKRGLLRLRSQLRPGESLD
jgi:RNA polymerase sigma-70 factor (ECF subfamily)